MAGPCVSTSVVFHARLTIVSEVSARDSGQRPAGNCPLGMGCCLPLGVLPKRRPELVHGVPAAPVEAVGPGPLGRRSGGTPMNWCMDLSPLWSSEKVPDGGFFPVLP